MGVRAVCEDEAIKGAVAGHIGSEFELYTLWRDVKQFNEGKPIVAISITVGYYTTLIDHSSISNPNKSRCQR